MATTIPVQSNFAAGEISPRFLSQIDSDVYKHGVRSMINFIPEAQGPFYRRHGFRYQGQVPGNNGRLFEFPVTKDFVIFAILTDQNKLYLGTPDGLLRDGNVVSNAYFLQGSTGWTDVSQNSGFVIFLTGSAQLTPGTVHPTQDRYAGVKQTITLATGAVDHAIEIVTEPNQTLSDMRIMVGTTDGGADLLDVTVGSSISHYIGTFTPGGVTTVYLQIRALENNNGAIRTVTYANINNPASNDLLSFTTPWDASELDLIQVGYPPGEDRLFFVSPQSPPQELIFNRSTEVWTFQPVSFTGAPAVWTTNNYPGAITFYQGRMWLGGTPGQPETFWGSKSAQYRNFTTGSLADDGLSFTMAEKGQILWMVGTKNLLIGTEFGEFIVTSSDGVITPSDIQVDQQSAYGSARIQPVKIGNRVLYISPDRRKVRDMGYKWTDDGWVSRNITFGSEHITLGNPIKAMAFGQNPGNLLFCVTQTRNIIGGTYERGNDIVGWFNGTTDGEFIAIASADLDGTSTMAALFNRNIESTPTLYFEICYPAPTEGACVVDSGQVFGGQAGTPISSVVIPHLKNKEVRIIVDGALHPVITLDANGEGDLQFSGDTVVVGLGYTGYVRTLPLASMLQVGQSTLPMMKRYSRIFLRVFDSAIPKINGVRPATRRPSTPMGSAEELVTEDIRVANLGWTQEAEIEITQELPLFTQIAGVFGEAAQETRS